MRVNAKGILSRFALHATFPRDGGGMPASVDAECHGGRSTRDLYASGPRITCVDQAVIHEYFREYGDTTSLLAGGSADEPHELRLRELPLRLERRLSRLSPGFERAWKGRDLLLIETRTGRVVDILRSARLAH